MTLYIDVYFFVNLSVDLLCLCMASSVSGVPSGKVRLCLLAVFGSLLSCVSIFVSAYPWAVTGLSVAYFLAICLFADKGIRAMRRFRFAVFFLLFQILVGGGVYYFYGLLERWGWADITFSDTVAPNRKLLVLSVALLVLLGIFRLIRLCLLPLQNEKSVRVKVCLFGLSVVFSGLVDTGNLLREPLSGLPVILLRREKAQELFSEGKIPSEITDWKEPYQKRLRLIPVEGGKLLFGIVPDKTELSLKRGSAAVDVAIAIDKENSGFGGYDALVPGEVLESV